MNESIERIPYFHHSTLIRLMSDEPTVLSLVFKINGTIKIKVSSII